MVDINAGAGALTMNSTATGAASNLSHVGAAGQDLTVECTAGSLNLTGAEADAAAVKIQATDAAGGIDMDAGTGGITIDTTGAFSIDSSATGAASNLSHAGGAGQDLTVECTAGSLNLTGAEADAAAVNIDATAGGVKIDGHTGVTIDASNSGGVAMTSTAGSITLTTSAVAQKTTFKGNNGSDVVTLGEIGSVAANHMMGMMQYVNKHVTFTSSTTLVSCALAQPADTILTNLGFICTTAISKAGTDNTTLVVGTSPGGNQITTSTDIISSDTGTPAGTGISLISNQFPQTEASVTTLTSTMVANSQHTTSSRDIHFTLTNASQVFTAGKVCFFIEYMHVKTT